MKTLFAILLISMTARAELFEGIPEEYCSPEYYDCSEFTKDIVKNYSAAQAPVMNSDEALYAGSCYMVSRQYDKDHEHFGYLYFRKQDGKIDFFGQFSFFGENPYVNMTIEEARQLNAAKSEYQLTETSTDWRIATNIEPPWQYFMREAGSQLFVVGFWGYNDSITCTLEKK